jgi:hypothetical protein
MEQECKWTKHDIQIIFQGENDRYTQRELQNVWDFGLEDYQVGDKQLKL